MKPETLNAIEYIINWFSEEDLDALAIRSRRSGDNSHSVSLKEQLIGRYFNHIPIYNTYVMRAKIAMILNANRNLFDRLILINSEGFLQKMREDLNSIDSFVIENKTNINWDGYMKSANVGKSLMSSMHRASAKTRGGSADSGQEYVEIDKLWDAEDMKFLNHGSPLKRDLPHIEKIENKDEAQTSNPKSKNKKRRNIDSYNISLLTRADKQGLDKFDETNEDDPKEIEEKLEEDKIALYSINSSQSRSKTLSNTDASNFLFSENSRDGNTDKTKTFTSVLNAYQKFFSLHVKDLREVAFKKLDVLFERLPCQFV